MRRIRIGKDIIFNWQVTTNGESRDLGDRDLTLVMHMPNGRDRRIPFITDRDVVNFRFDGVEQEHLGIYSLTLWENYGKKGQTCVDLPNAFELVEYSWMEN